MTTTVRSRISTTSFVLTAVSVLCLALASCGSSSAPNAQSVPQAICPAAILAASPLSVRAGGTIELHGAYWGPTCNDVNPTTSDAPSKFTTAITVLIVQGRRSFLLAKVEAGPDGSFEATATLPAGLKPGSATITASPGYGNDKLEFIDTPSGKIDVDGQVTIKIAGDD